MKSRLLRIGEMAARVGLNPKTLRFYEAAGLLPSPLRGSNGYRLYPPEVVNLLGFVKAAQGLGLTLEDIKEIISIRRAGRPPCIHVRDLLEAKAKEMDRKLADLLALRRRIRQTLSAWEGRRVGQSVICPHIEKSRTAKLRTRVKRHG